MHHQRHGFPLELLDFGAQVQLSQLVLLLVKVQGVLLQTYVVLFNCEPPLLLQAFETTPQII